MKIKDLIKTTPVFSHINYEGIPLTADKMDFALSLEYGERVLKPAIEIMMNDSQASSYLDIIGSTIVSMYEDKWNKLKDIAARTNEQLINRTTITTHNELNNQTSVNSVWGVSDTESQNKEKTSNDGSINQTTQTNRVGVIDIDKSLKASNIDIVSLIVCDVANYLSLYVLE